MNNQNYFVILNKILTSALAGIIASGIGFGTYHAMNIFFNLDINAISAINYQLFLNVLVGFTVALIALNPMQTYFFHLLEKDKYNQIGKSFGLNLIAVVGMFTISNIFSFLLLTQSLNATIWVLIGFVNFLLIFNSIVREKCTLSSTVTILVSSMVSSYAIVLIILIAQKQSLGLAIIVGLFSLPIWTTLNELAQSAVVLMKENTAAADVAAAAAAPLDEAGIK